jgi:LPS sulfotransferase NodH
LRQAISLVRAVQTEQWRSMDAIALPHYDAEAIADGLRFLSQDEANWEAFFDRSAVSPYRLTYEELESSPQDAITALLTYLGSGEPQPIPLSPSRHRRQSDDLTEEWLRRFTSDREELQ